MSVGLYWFAMFVGLLAVSAAVSFALAERAEWVGCLPVPLATSVLMTIYVVNFAPDPQAPIFLAGFYIIAAVAGAFGSIFGREMARRLANRRRDR